MVGPLQGSAHPRAPQGHQACCHSPPDKKGYHLHLSKENIIATYKKEEEIISTKTLLEENIHFLILLCFFLLIFTFFHIFFCNFTSVFFSPESLLHLSLIWPVASLILKIWLLSFLLFYISVFLLLLKCGDCFCEVCLWPR